MLANLREQVTSVLSHVELRVQPQPAFAHGRRPSPRMAMAEEARATGTTGRPSAAAPRRSAAPARATAPTAAAPRPAGPRAPWAGTPRNAPCPCGSGKKFKHCHGRV